MNTGDLKHVRSENSLTGQMLVASPSINSRSYFFKAVIYILKDSDVGSVGVIVNHPIEDIKDTFVVSRNHKLDVINLGKAYAGGPIGIDVACLLYLDQYNGIDSTKFVQIGGEDILKKIMEDNKNAKQKMLVLGHCAWGAGQLEEEIRNGSWMVMPVDKKIIFSNDSKDKWIKCINSLKINLACYVYGIGNG